MNLTGSGFRGGGGGGVANTPIIISSKNVSMLTIRLLNVSFSLYASC